LDVGGITMKVKVVTHDAITGKTVEKEEDITPKTYPEQELKVLRYARNELLAETDYMMLADTATISDAWKKYRQELRDITKTFKSMGDKDFKFPTKPKE